MGNILKIDLSSGSVVKVPTESYSNLFLGGRGIAAKLYWDDVPPDINAIDPRNSLIFMTGPLCGVPGFASRFQICGKSISSNTFSFCNLGGSWGAYLKMAGYDGLAVTGRANTMCYILINNNSVEIVKAEYLKGTTAFECERTLKERLGESVRVLTVGPAGENMVSFATFLASDDSCGAGGLAGVMGSKNLKAIVVTGNRKVAVANPGEIRLLQERARELRSGLPEEMETLGWLMSFEGLKKTPCRGCPSGCVRVTYHKPDGEVRKFMCQASLFYQTRAERYYGQATDVPPRATEACDDYGLDTRAIETMIMWLSRCHKSGLLTDEQTGILLSQLGSFEFIDTLCRKIAYREGFGDVLAQGTHKAAEQLGADAQRLIKDYITNTGDNDIYGPRLYITTGLFYATEPRFPIQHLHEISVPVMMWAARVMGIEDVFVTSEVFQKMARRFMGSEIAVDFSTYEGKALAAAKIQDREYAKESLILCDLTWPIFFSSKTPDCVGDPSMESRMFSAVTGREVDEEGLYKIGERNLNMQRAILVREGRGGREWDTIDEFNFTTPLKSDFGNPECLVPGKNGEAFSRKGSVIDRGEFEKMKDEYYEIRGWDVATGLQTKSKLSELSLADVAQKMEEEGLVVL